jgi:hypothetical protein
MPSDDLLIIERAYELAASGRFTTVKDIRARLKAERFTAAAISAHFNGRSLRRDLASLCQANNPPARPAAKARSI